MEPIRSKQHIIHDLKNLVIEPGYIYVFAFLLRRDLFIDPADAADIDWRSRLSFQEMAMLLGLLLKEPISLALPNPDGVDALVERTEVLLRELQWAYNSPALENIKQAAEKISEGTLPEERPDAFFTNPEMLAEPIFYGGSDAYDFQYLEFTPKRYHADKDWLDANRGIDGEELAECAMRLFNLQEEKAQKVSPLKSPTGLLSDILDAFCFTEEELGADENKKLLTFAKLFTVTPGTVNRLYFESDASTSEDVHNMFESHPIIHLSDGRFFAPIWFSLSKAIYEVPAFWMRQDLTYRDAAAQNRGDTTVEIAQEMLVPIFGESNVYKDVKVLSPQKDVVTDIDLLVVSGNKAIIIQAKSKKLTDLAKYGNDKAMRDDFKKAIQDAYDQGTSSAKALAEKSYSLLDHDGNPVNPGEGINDAYIICLTADGYPAVIHQMESFLVKEANDPYPVGISLFDLDIMCFYLNDPLEFLYYLRQRRNLTGCLRASNEATFLGYHLNQKLKRIPGIDYVGIDEAFGQLIDANFPAMRGWHPRTEASEKLHKKWSNKKFDALVGEIKSSGNPRFIDAVFALYDLSDADCDQFIHSIEFAKESVDAGGPPRVLSVISEEQGIGVSYVYERCSQAQLGVRVYGHAAARKYRSKLTAWLGLGSRVGSNRLVEVAVYSKEPWSPDPSLEKLAKHLLKPGINYKSVKVGRNRPCHCGSGKKYKFCHGR